MDTPQITLRQVWRDYKTVRVLKDHTIYDYEKKLKSVEDWMDLDMNTITKNMVEDRHRSLSALIWVVMTCLVGSIDLSWLFGIDLSYVLRGVTFLVLTWLIFREPEPD